jgi:hypothetical protein
MRKYLFILLFLPIQSLFAGEFFVGTTQGINFSQVSFVPTVSERYLMGYNGGIVARYISEPNLGIQAELLFSQRGWSEKHDDTGSIQRRMNYVELPLMTHIYFGKRAFRGFVNLGPTVAILTGESATTGLTDSPTVIEATEPEGQARIIPDQRFYRFNEPVTTKFDYGIAGGLGFGVVLKRIFCQVEGRYSFGLGDFFETSKTFYERAAFRNISVNFSVMYRL